MVGRVAHTYLRLGPSAKTGTLRTPRRPQSEAPMGNDDLTFYVARKIGKVTAKHGFIFLNFQFYSESLLSWLSIVPRLSVLYAAEPSLSSHHSLSLILMDALDVLFLLDFDRLLHRQISKALGLPRRCAPARRAVKPGIACAAALIGMSGEV